MKLTRYERGVANMQRNQNFQWKLIQLRKEAGITQKQMAEILNINVATYVRKETGQNDFLSSEMFKISDFFARSLEEIFLPSNSIDNAKIKI